jgi:hypothetical protein
MNGSACAAFEGPPAAQPAGQIRRGDDPHHLAILGDQDPPGLAVLELAEHVVHPGIGGHHDLITQRDHVVPDPTGRPLLPGHPPDPPRVNRPIVRPCSSTGKALWS